MDNNASFVIRDTILLGIFKTVYLFLLNHNFPKSAATLKNECGLYNGNIDTFPSKSLLLRKCRCSKNQANQTELKTGSKSKGEWLEGSYEGGPVQIKDDETHVFYVCDHCQQTSENNSRLAYTRLTGIKFNSTGLGASHSNFHIKKPCTRNVIDFNRNVFYIQTLRAFPCSVELSLSFICTG